jgi:two-component system OmpR family sensor kinase
MLKSLRSRIYASFVFIVLVTLGTAGFAFFFTLGGYRDDLASSTLREVALPVYYNLTAFSPRTFTARELGVYLAEQSRETDVLILVLDDQGRVVRETATEESLLNERIELPPRPPTAGFPDPYEGTHTTQDGQELLFVAVPLPPRFALGALHASTLVVALPKDSAQSIIGDLTPRLLLAGLAGLGAALVVGLVLSRSVYLPLGRVARAARAVGRGDYRRKVPVEGPSEARGLAEDFNSMTEAVQRSQQTLRDFLANISHELKTPLTSIRGFSQAMRDGTIDDEEGRERATRVIDTESRHVLYLVEELLDLSRIESGQVSMTTAPLEVRELFAHCADVFAMRSQESGVEIRVDDVSVPSVMGDFDRLEQVLGNLVDNAFRHTPRGGWIRLSARSLPGRAGTAPDMVEVTVADSGEGIPGDELPHVFDRFYKGSSTSDASGRGARHGLGLPIAREVVRAHGGDLWAEGGPEGGGRFRFTLPVATG